MTHRYIFHFDDNGEYEHDSTREYTNAEVTNLAAELKSQNGWSHVTKVEHQVVGEPTEIKLTRDVL